MTTVDKICFVTGRRFRYRSPIPIPSFRGAQAAKLIAIKLVLYKVREGLSGNCMIYTVASSCHCKLKYACRTIERNLFLIHSIAVVQPLWLVSELMMYAFDAVNC